MAHQAASTFLKKFVATTDSKHSTVGDLVEQLGTRSFALVLLILSLPQAGPWPMPPGMSAIMGLPMLFIALQLAWGNDSIWLPDRLEKKKFAPARLKRIIGKIIPTLRWIEKLLKPRCLFMFKGFTIRAIGLLIAVMALVMSLPIPGGNFLPAISVAFLSLAVLQRDGLLAIFSIIFSVVILVVMYHLMGAALDTVSDWFN